jgi:hypothetical protein
MSYDKRYKIKRLPENEGIHIPDKKECKTLRKIMSESGLTEKEIRNIPKYKWLLARSEQQNQYPKRTEKQKLLDKIMKTVTRELKLAKEHPLVQEEFKNRVNVEKSKLGTWNSRLLSRPY